MKKFDFFRLKLYLKLHNYLNNRIGSLAVRLNNGIHPKHRILNYHKFFLDHMQSNSKVLDIGCGIGVVTCKIAQKANSVVGIDKNTKSIEIASNQYQKGNIKYIIGDATTYNFNEKFDYIILSNVLEHIKDRNLFLNRIKSKADYILIRVPVLNRSWLPIYKKEMGLEYRLDKTHYIEYTIDSFQKELKQADLKILNMSVQFGEIWAKVGKK